MPTRRSLKAENAKRASVHPAAEPQNKETAPTPVRESALGSGAQEPAEEKPVLQPQMLPSVQPSTEEPAAAPAGESADAPAPAAPTEGEGGEEESAAPQPTGRKKVNLRRAKVKTPAQPKGEQGEGAEASQEGAGEGQPGENAEASAAGEEGAPSKIRRVKVASGTKKLKITPLRVILAVIIALVVAFLAVVGWFAADRWLLHDDKEDIQGTWMIYGSQKGMVIDDQLIHLTDDVSYKYTMDVDAKTITYTVGTMTGTSHYRFSGDRQTVALLEDGKEVFTATLFDDISWWLNSFGKIFSQEPILPADPSDTTALLQRPAPAQPAPEPAAQPADPQVEQPVEPQPEEPTE